MPVGISSSWPCVTGTLACTEVSSLDSFQLSDISPDGCVHLGSDSESDSRGELTLTTTGNFSISGVLIVTDCPRWEVVGGIQYLKSVQGTLLDSFEGTNLFSVQLKLQKSYEKLTLRLPPSVRSCWVYCAQVVSTVQGSVRMGHFDINNVNNLLGVEKQLSSKAEKFKSLFENFQSCQSSSDRSKELTNVPPKMSDLMLNPMLMQSMLGHSTNNTTSSGVTEDGSPLNNENKDTNFVFLKTYIDKKFEKMELNILRVIQEKDRIQNEKLDIILKHLNPVKDDRS